MPVDHTKPALPSFQKARRHNSPPTEVRPRRQMVRILVLSIFVVFAGPRVYAQGDPASIPEIVRSATIEGVQIGMSRADAAAALAAGGYVAAPKPERSSSVGRGTRDPCSLPGSQDTDKYATPVAKAPKSASGLRTSSAGEVINPYVSSVEVTFGCGDQKVVRISRDAAAYWQESDPTPRASAQRFFVDASSRYGTLCPSPAASDSKTDERFTKGSMAGMKSGVIRCGRGQSLLSAKFVKEHGGLLFDYSVGLRAFARNATYKIEVSVQPSHDR